VLLATLVGLDGFCFEYQDPTTAAADLMARFKPYALQYGLGMTVHWIPASACAWFPEKYPNRDAMVDMGKVVVEQVTNDYILPTGATFTPAGESEERPIWFLFSWDRNATHTGAGYVPETRLDEVRGEFGFDPDELEALRSHSLASTRTNPLFLGCSWSFVDTKWPWPRSSPRRPVRESGDEPRALGRSGRDDRFPTEKADFPMAGPLDGLYGWPAPALDEMVPNHVYYNAHCVVPQAKDRIGTVAQNLKHGRRGYDSQELSIAAGEFAVRAGTVFPGFDDPYNAAWNTGFRRYIPRNDDKGTTLEQTFKMLTDYRADIGLFATFADWAESTTLEPTVETGCETAVAAAEGIARWKTEGLTTVQKEDLGRLIDIVVEIHRLRRKSAFLAKAGCATTQLGQLTAAIDAIIPVLLAKRLPEVEEKLRDAKKTTEGLESQLGEKSSVVLEWSDFAQAAMRNADGDVGRTRPPGADSTADATPVPLTDSLTHRIEMGRDCFTATPDARQRLRNSVYTDGRITLEYKDDGVSWLAVRVNNTDGFPTNVDEWAEIVKLRKEDTGSWQKATADFVAASFDQRFADRPDLIIEPQGSMIYVEPFSHQAPDLGVTLWVRHAEAVGATQNYLVLVDTELGKEVFRLRSNGSAVEAAVELGNTELDTVSTGADVLKRNWWHHIAAVWNGAAGTLNLYVDGVCVAGQGRTFTGRLATNTNQLLIGTLQGGLEGHVSDVQVYTSPLTATQIAAVRQGGSDSGLAGRWSCERDPDTAPQVVTDTSGKGRHGTLYNGAAWDESVDGRPAVRLTGTGQGAQLRKVTIRLNTLPRPPDAAVKGQ
jgi:hypothetical protein